MKSAVGEVKWSRAGKERKYGFTMIAALAIEDNENIQEPWHTGDVIISLTDIKREF